MSKKYLTDCFHNFVMSNHVKQRQRLKDARNKIEKGQVVAHV